MTARYLCGHLLGRRDNRFTSLFYKATHVEIRLHISLNIKTLQLCFFQDEG
jgi:hypothetical protein